MTGIFVSLWCTLVGGKSRLLLLRDMGKYSDKVGTPGSRDKEHGCKRLNLLHI